MLALHVIVITKDLMRIQNTKGWLKTCADLVKKNEYPINIHKQRTRPDIEVGDFVIVNSDLAQVVKVIISKAYRYKSFKIRYLKEPPLPGITEDVVPGDWVRILYKREPLLKHTVTVIKQNTPHTKIATLDINKKLRDGVIDGWDNGIKERMLNPTPENIEKFEQYKRVLMRRSQAAMALAKQSKNSIK